EFHRCFKSAGRTANSHNRAKCRLFLFFCSAIGAELRFGVALNGWALRTRAFRLSVRGHGPHLLMMRGFGGPKPRLYSSLNSLRCLGATSPQAQTRGKKPS